MGGENLTHSLEYLLLNLGHPASPCADPLKGYAKLGKNHFNHYRIHAVGP